MNGSRLRLAATMLPVSLLLLAGFAVPIVIVAILLVVLIFTTNNDDSAPFIYNIF